MAQVTGPESRAASSIPLNQGDQALSSETSLRDTKCFFTETFQQKSNILLKWLPPAYGSPPREFPLKGPRLRGIKKDNERLQGGVPVPCEKPSRASWGLTSNLEKHAAVVCVCGGGRYS